jgi:hypothetical protein
MRFLSGQLTRWHVLIVTILAEVMNFEHQRGFRYSTTTHKRVILWVLNVYDDYLGNTKVAILLI